MAQTPNLLLDLLEVGQAQKETTINNNYNKLDNAFGGVLTKNVAGGANVTLTAAEAANAIIIFTGAITANINVTIPDNTKRVYSIANNTTGAFSLTFKTVTGTGVKLRQSRAQVVYSDGTNVNFSESGPDVAKAGTLIGGRKKLNFTDTASVVWTITDDNTNDEIDITAAASGGGGGGDSTTTSNYASRPAPSNNGDVFFPSDAFTLERDTGSAYGPWGPLFALIRPVLADFTAVNQGSATISDARGTLEVVAPTSSGDNLRIWKKTAPATPYTITAALLPTMPGVNFFVAGIGWRQSSDGKIISHALSYSSTWGIRTEKWNSPTSYNAAYVTFPLGFNGPLLWLRIRDDGTNRLTYISNDGQNWIQIHSVGRTDFLTADEVGFFLNINNTSYQAALNLMSWQQS